MSKGQSMRQYIRNCLLIILSFILLSNVCCMVPSLDKVGSLIEITDQLGRVVKLVKIPERIISLAPSNTEILYALGLEDKVVAVTDYCNYPPEAKSKTSIGGFTTPDMEKIVALSPDLVLATSIHQTRVIPYLEGRGIPVFALAPKTLDDVLDSIALVGEITEKNDKASMLVNEMRDRIKTIVDKTNSLPQEQRPKVFYIIWHDPLTTAGSGTLHDELIRKAGGINVAQGLRGYTSIALEAIIQANPEVLIAGVGMGAGGDLPIQFVRTELRLKDTNALQNDHVYAIDTDLVGRAGPRIIDALEQFAGFIYPQLFK